MGETTGGSPLDLAQRTPHTIGLDELKAYYRPDDDAEEMMTAVLSGLSQLRQG